MANLNGQNIGTNYKGILNLNTLNGNLSGTLQAVTDGDGNASALQLSTTGVTINSALIVNNSVEGTTSGRMNIIAQYDLAIQTGNSASGIGGLFVGGAGQAASARLHVRCAASTNAALFETSGLGEIVTIGVGGGNTSRFLGAIRADVINDYANGYTLFQYVSATQIRVGSDSLRLNPTTLEAIFNGTIRAASLPTTRPATVGDLYQDTAANILANNDKVVGIRV